jgi:hypothetical protein
MRRSKYGIYPHWLYSENGEDLCQSCWAKSKYVPKPRKAPVTIEETRKRVKLWRQQNPERCKYYTRKYKRSSKELWGSPGKLDSLSNTVSQSEIFAAEQILPREGFNSILLTREYSPRFFCDILAKDRDDRECAFDVKMSYGTYIKKEENSIAEKSRSSILYSVP